MSSTDIMLASYILVQTNYYGLHMQSFYILGCNFQAYLGPDRSIICPSKKGQPNASRKYMVKEYLVDDNNFFGQQPQ